MAVSDSKRVVIAALIANLAVTIVKGIAAVFTGSGAMLAETIHSAADTGNQGLLLFGAARAKRPPDKRHPFGYGSERYFWAFVVALLLFTLGALFSLYEGVHRLMDPTPIQNAEWAYGVLAAAFLIDLWSYVVARRAVRRVQGDRSFLSYFLEAKDPALPLVYLEDLGASLGVLLAMGGVAGNHLLGWLRADAIATLAVGVLLLCVAVALLMRCYRLLIGESASVKDEEAIRVAAASVAGVEAILDLKTMHHGPETLIVTLDVRFDGTPEIVMAIEEAVRAVVPVARHVSVEPR